MITLYLTPPIDLKGLGIAVPRSLRRRDEAGPLTGLHYLLVVEAGEYLLPDTVVRRSDGIAPQRMYVAGLTALGHARRLSGTLAGRGYDDAWAQGFEDNLITLNRLLRNEQAEQYTSEVEALVNADTTLHLGAAVRSILMVATPAGGRVFFNSQVSDLQTPEGVLNAAHEIVIKAALAPVKARLGEFGVSDAMLKEIKDLLARTERDFRARVVEEASSARLPTGLRLVRALVLQELTALSATARTDLGEELAEPLQMTNLLDLATRREAEPAPAGPAAPAPAPASGAPGRPAVPVGGGGVPAAPVVGPGVAVHGAAAPSGGTTPAAVAPSGGTTPAAVAPPGGPLAGVPPQGGTAPAGAGGAPAGGAAPAGGGLRPGQVLETRRSTHGIEVLIVQDNQSAAWVTLPEPPRTGAAAPAVPTAAPAPRGRSSRRGGAAKPGLQ